MYMQYTIYNHVTKKPLVSVEILREPGSSEYRKLRLAVIAAIDSGKSLENADLRGGLFHNIDFRNTKLINANLSLADLTYSDLSNAKLDVAIFTGALLYKTKLSEKQKMLLTLQDDDIVWVF